MTNLIEAGIEPLAHALNTLDFIKTIYSCEGHFDRPPNPKFLPTAYVTFSTTDSDSFERLFERIRDANKSDPLVSLRMTYDCILGLYTLSLWPDTSMRTASQRRAAVDGAVARLAKMVLDSARRPGVESTRKKYAESGAAYPCGEICPPCTLVIPPQEFMCPFNRPN